MSILSIQSHVAYGHVGNSAAVFALQRLGIEVWPVMTVQLSNHTGYPSWRGRAFEADHIAEVVAGLDEMGLLAGCEAVLSGYLGSAAIGGAVLDAVARVRRANAGAVHLCDPVMGDRGRGLFVPEEVAAFVRDQAVPRANIVTPNLFELERLTGRQLEDPEGALAAARSVLDLGPDIVLVTSVRFPERHKDEVALLAVARDAAWRVATPWLELAAPVNGAGDVLAALFLGLYLRAVPGPARVPDALTGAAAAIFALIEATRRSGARELALIGAQDALVNPERTFPAEPLD
jgi:pyridoxine kinase